MYQVRLVSNARLVYVESFTNCYIICVINVLDGN